MTIAVLAEEVVARIAAGEAVERPASAVKELVENAIDAGATAVHVDVAGGGRKLIRVSDNGSGIPNPDIKLAFKRHATSKIRAAEELQALSTLGFRGEALASISAVSQSTIITRHRDDKMGVSLRLTAGEILSESAIGAPAGTVVTVENLFFNTPARLKFLKADRTEKSHIQQVVARYAMAYPNIAFTLKQDDREQIRSSGRGDLADAVAQVYGLAQFKRMIALDDRQSSRIGEPAITVSGYASLPSLTRSDRTRIAFFVNGRAVQDNSLSHAVAHAYEGLIKTGTFPLALVLITMPTQLVDVNVHPTKAEVRFRDSRQVFSAVQRVVRQALLENDDLDVDEGPWSLSGFSNQYIEYSTPPSLYPGYNRDDSFDDIDLASIPDTAENPAKPRTLPVLRVVGQVGASYIVAEGPAGLYLVDQNAAHERVLYEQIAEDRQAGRMKIERPSESKAVLLSPDDSELLKSLDHLFTALGFEIEEFGPNTYVCRALPDCLATLRLDAALPGILQYIRKQDMTESNMVIALALVAAAKRGQILQMEEMQTLVAQLERCPSPLASPSGKTILVHLTREQLASEFRRASAGV